MSEERGIDDPTFLRVAPRTGRRRPRPAGVERRPEGPGSDPARQERSHPHCVPASPDGRFAVVADLGLDALTSDRFGPGGVLSSEPAAVTRLTPGCGHRHLVLHQGETFAICELDSTVASPRYEAGSGRFDVVAVAPTLPEGHGSSHCSDVRIHPNGRWVYAADRGHDSIAVLALDPDSGALTPRRHHPCKGRTPRHLALDPTGRHLVVADQDSDALGIFALDEGGS